MEETNEKTQLHAQIQLGAQTNIEWFQNAGSEFNELFWTVDIGGLDALEQLDAKSLGIPDSVKLAMRDTHVLQKLAIELSYMPVCSTDWNRKRLELRREFCLIVYGVYPRKTHIVAPYIQMPIFRNYLWESSNSEQKKIMENEEEFVKTFNINFPNRRRDGKPPIHHRHFNNLPQMEKRFHWNQRSGTETGTGIKTELGINLGINSNFGQIRCCNWINEMEEEHNMQNGRKLQLNHKLVFPIETETETDSK